MRAQAPVESAWFVCHVLGRGDRSGDDTKNPRVGVCGCYTCAGTKGIVWERVGDSR